MKASNIPEEWKQLRDKEVHIQIRKEMSEMSPIMLAVTEGDIPLLRYLIESTKKVLKELGKPDQFNIDLTYGESPSKTALTYAIKAHEIEAANLLLEHGANPNLQDDMGLPPLTIAAMAGNPKLPDDLDLPPLIIAAISRKSSISENGEDEDMLQVLIKAKANINDQSEGADADETPLMYLVAQNCYEENQYGESIKRLLQLGASVDLLDENGQSALSLAAGNRDSNSVASLLDSGASLIGTDGLNKNLFEIAATADSKCWDNSHTTLFNVKLLLAKAAFKSEADLDDAMESLNNCNNITNKEVQDYLSNPKLVKEESKRNSQFKSTELLGMLNQPREIESSYEEQPINTASAANPEGTLSRAEEVRSKGGGGAK